MPALIYLIYALISQTVASFNLNQQDLASLRTNDTKDVINFPTDREQEADDLNLDSAHYHRDDDDSHSSEAFSLAEERVLYRRFDYDTRYNADGMEPCKQSFLLEDILDNVLELLDNTHFKYLKPNLAERVVRAINLYTNTVPDIMLNSALSQKLKTLVYHFEDNVKFLKLQINQAHGSLRSSNETRTKILFKQKLPKLDEKPCKDTFMKLINVSYKKYNNLAKHDGCVDPDGDESFNTVAERKLSKDIEENNLIIYKQLMHQLKAYIAENPVSDAIWQTLYLYQPGQLLQIPHKLPLPAYSNNYLTPQIVESRPPLLPVLSRGYPRQKLTLTQPVLGPSKLHMFNVNPISWIAREGEANSKGDDTDSSLVEEIISQEGEDSDKRQLKRLTVKTKTKALIEKGLPRKKIIYKSTKIKVPKIIYVYPISKEDGNDELSELNEELSEDDIDELMQTKILEHEGSTTALPSHLVAEEEPLHALLTEIPSTLQEIAHSLEMNAESQLPSLDNLIVSNDNANPSPTSIAITTTETINSINVDEQPDIVGRFVTLSDEHDQPEITTLHVVDDITLSPILDDDKKSLNQHLNDLLTQVKDDDVDTIDDKNSLNKHLNDLLTQIKDDDVGTSSPETDTSNLSKDESLPITFTTEPITETTFTSYSITDNVYDATATEHSWTPNTLPNDVSTRSNSINHETTDSQALSSPTNPTSTPFADLTHPTTLSSHDNPTYNSASLNEYNSLSDEENEYNPTSIEKPEQNSLSNKEPEYYSSSKDVSTNSNSLSDEKNEYNSSSIEGREQNSLSNEEPEYYSSSKEVSTDSTNLEQIPNLPTTSTHFTVPTTLSVSSPDSLELSHFLLGNLTNPQPSGTTESDMPPEPKAQTETEQRLPETTSEYFPGPISQGHIAIIPEYPTNLQPSGTTESDMPPEPKLQPDTEQPLPETTSEYFPGPISQGHIAIIPENPTNLQLSRTTESDMPPEPKSQPDTEQPWPETTSEYFPGPISQGHIAIIPVHPTNLQPSGTTESDMPPEPKLQPDTEQPLPETTSEYFPGPISQGHIAIIPEHPTNLQSSGTTESDMPPEPKLQPEAEQPLPETTSEYFPGPISQGHIAIIPVHPTNLQLSGTTESDMPPEPKLQPQTEQPLPETTSEYFPGPISQGHLAIIPVHPTNLQLSGTTESDMPPEPKLQPDTEQPLPETTSEYFPGPVSQGHIAIIPEPSTIPVPISSETEQYSSSEYNIENNSDVDNSDDSGHQTLETRNPSTDSVVNYVVQGADNPVSSSELNRPQHSEPSPKHKPAKSITVLLKHVPLPVVQSRLKNSNERDISGNQSPSFEILDNAPIQSNMPQNINLYQHEVFAPKYVTVTPKTFVSVQQKPNKLYEVLTKIKNSERPVQWNGKYNLNQFNLVPDQLAMQSRFNGWQNNPNLDYWTPKQAQVQIVGPGSKYVNIANKPSTAYLNTNLYAFGPQNNVPQYAANGLQAELGQFGQVIPHEVELTYVVKRPRPILYQPYYYVKYRIPYPSFISNINNLLRVKPSFSGRENLSELLYQGNITDMSPDLRHLSRQYIDSLVSTSGSVVKETAAQEGRALNRGSKEDVRTLMVELNDLAKKTQSNPEMIVKKVKDWNNTPSPLNYDYNQNLNREVDGIIYSSDINSDNENEVEPFPISKRNNAIVKSNGAQKLLSNEK